MVVVWAIPPSHFKHRDLSVSPQKHSKEQNTDLDLQKPAHTRAALLLLSYAIDSGPIE